MRKVGPTPPTICCIGNELGLVEAAPAKIHFNSSAQLRFCKPRTVPYALTGKVEQELEWLESTGIISAVQFATPTRASVSTIGYNLYPNFPAL